MDSEEAIEQSLSELEKNALNRKQRLRELREKFASKNDRTENDEGANTAGENESTEKQRYERFYNSKKFYF